MAAMRRSSRLGGALASPTALDYAGALRGTPAPPEPPAPTSASTSAGAAAPPLTPDDRRRMVVLVMLYLVQGVPLGLVFGTLPFVLKSAALSYTALGVFSMAGYPYSLKLLWSPIVDAVYWPGFGRRKSWVVPTQLMIALLLFAAAPRIDGWLAPDGMPMATLTALAAVLVLCAATQDIAVDGWALEMLPQAHRAYAATCQTIGLNAGYFLSFTVYLALASADTCNLYLREPWGWPPQPVGVVTLSGALAMWALLYLLVTAYVAVWQQEDAPDTHVGTYTPRTVYGQLWQICRLPRMWLLMAVLLTHRLAFAVNDRVTAYKLLELGFRQEHLALTALVDFPLEVLIGVYATRYARSHQPLRPWLYGYLVRLALAALAMAVVAAYPVPPDTEVPLWYFYLVLGSALATSASGTIMFVSMSAYFSVLSDPAIGGTYMTLLNTFSNLGGAWPGLLVLVAVDAATQRVCSPDSACVVVRDGYMVVGTAAVIVGLAYWALFLRPAVKMLETTPLAQWRLRTPIPDKA